MKFIKKSLCVILAAVIVLSCAVSAFAQTKQEQTPLVIVCGLNTLPLYLDKDTENETQVFGPDTGDIVNAVFKCLPYLLFGYISNNWDACAEKMAPVVVDLFDELAISKDNESVYNVTCSQFDESYAYYLKNHDDEFFAAAGELGRYAAEEIGAENVYVYVSDWRMTAVHNAIELNDLIEKALSDTGADKVTIAPISQGGTIATTYLYRYGYDDIANVVMLSSAFNGIQQVGDLFSGRVNFDLEAVMQMLCDGADTEAKADGFNVLIDMLEFIGLFDILGPVIDKPIAEMSDIIFETTLFPTFGTLGGMWSFVPHADYETAKAFMFPDGIEGNKTMADVEEYQYNVLAKTTEILQGAMDAGVYVTILSAYGRQLIPFVDEYNLNSDAVIDTYGTSAGATCAGLELTLGEDYVQQNTACGHDHVSEDLVVDASTCDFPEYTWFIRGMQHTEFLAGGNDPLNGFILWLITADRQLTVHDNADYPQFMEYERETKTLAPIVSTFSKFYFVDKLKGMLSK